MQRPRPILALMEFGVAAAARIGERFSRDDIARDNDDAGTATAMFYLRRKDFVVVAEAWRSALLPGDIDLIAWDGDALCFVEVKTRSSRGAFAAEFGVGDDKQETVKRLADAYVRQLPWKPGQPQEVAVRFDVVSVYLPAKGKADVQHLRSAFR